MAVPLATPSSHFSLMPARPSHLLQEAHPFFWPSNSARPPSGAVTVSYTIFSCNSAPKTPPYMIYPPTYLLSPSLCIKICPLRNQLKVTTFCQSGHSPILGRGRDQMSQSPRLSWFNSILCLLGAALGTACGASSAGGAAVVQMSR